jgi:hypothetical protein
MMLCAAVLALGSAAHAQFTFKTFDGKTIGSKVKPDYIIPFIDSPKAEREIYLTWEKERVKVVTVKYDIFEAIDTVTETHLYFNGFDPKRIQTGIDEGTLFIRQNEGWTAAAYKYTDSSSSCVAENFAQLNFPKAEHREAFVSKMVDKKLALSLDLDYTPGPPPIIKEYDLQKEKPASDSSTEAPEKPAQSEDKPKNGGSPTPAKPEPPAPKKREEVSVKLFNKSENKIEIVIKHGRGSSTITTINQRNSRRFDLKVGAEVRLKGSNQLLLTVTEKMHDTEQVIAK